MPAFPIGRRATLGLAATALGTSGAAAHHGWSWADSDQTELRGTIREIYIGQPHPTLRVEASDGLWIVELGNPQQTQRSGFSAASGAAGDAVVALGNRSRTSNEKRMKAVRVTLRGRTYDIYPERIQSG